MCWGVERRFAFSPDFSDEPDALEDLSCQDVGTKGYLWVGRACLVTDLETATAFVLPEHHRTVDGIYEGQALQDAIPSLLGAALAGWIEPWPSLVDED